MAYSTQASIWKGVAGIFWVERIRTCRGIEVLLMASQSISVFQGQGPGSFRWTGCGGGGIQVKGNMTGQVRAGKESRGGHYRIFPPLAPWVSSPPCLVVCSSMATTLSVSKHCLWLR